MEVVVMERMVYFVVVYLGSDYIGENGFWFLDGYFDVGNGEFWKSFELVDIVLNVDSFN